jgi:formylmethanofuran dehydrogenase subunit E
MKFHQPARRPVQTFTAAFDSDCDTCFELIYEGDEIGYLPGNDRPSCEDCVEKHNEGIEK